MPMEMRYADESVAWGYEALDRADRDAFVENLGKLLSQTRAGVLSCRVIYGTGEDRWVDVEFKGGFKKRIDITCDSYLAIIKDVVGGVW